MALLFELMRSVHGPIKHPDLYLVVIREIYDICNTGVFQDMQCALVLIYY